MYSSPDREIIENFIYYESRLLDEQQYETWESLWEDEDTLYWIPANGEGANPERQISIIYDNRQRLKTRVRQLLTGDHYAQVPKSRTQHFVSNVEIQQQDEFVHIIGSLLVMESRLGEMHLWPGKVSYQLRWNNEQFKIKQKKIVFVHNDQPVTSLAFII